MKFKDALVLLKEGKKIKLPSWDGYWVLQILNNTDGTSKNIVEIHCHDYTVINLANSKDIIDTLENISSEEWVEATSNNCALLAPCIGYEDARTLLKKGKLLRRKEWPVGVYIRQIENSTKIRKHYGTFHKPTDEYTYLVDDALAEDWYEIKQ